jgi:hypothetical protein
VVRGGVPSRCFVSSGGLCSPGAVEVLPRSRAAGFERQQAAAVRVSDDLGGGGGEAELLGASSRGARRSGGWRGRPDRFKFQELTPERPRRRDGIVRHRVTADRPGGRGNPGFGGRGVDGPVVPGRISPISPIFPGGCVESVSVVHSVARGLPDGVQGDRFR